MRLSTLFSALRRDWKLILWLPVYLLSFLEWDYAVTEACGAPVARLSKELFNWTDTYVIDVADPGNALCVLMLVLAIDAEKCSRD